MAHRFHDFHFSRRDLIRSAVASALGVSCSGWFPGLARAAAAKRTGRACILLWMNGGPSQTDTFDPKPGHANGGPVKAIATSVAGIHISEYLPKIAKEMDELAIIRSMSSREGDHSRRRPDAYRVSATNGHGVSKHRIALFQRAGTCR